MGNPRNVGGVRARSGRRRRVVESHYLTSREAAALGRTQREKDEAKGIFRRWNDRALTPEQQARATAHLRAGRRSRRRFTSGPVPPSEVAAPGTSGGR